jgi:GTP cyclohydrolase I
MEYTLKLPDNTPADAIERWQRAIIEMTGGYSTDPGLDVVFDMAYDEIIISRGIEFSSLCEHHLFPFFGIVDIAYIPFNGIVGLSKLARTVDCYGRRFQTQERMTQDIANALQTALNPKAIAVIIRATHTCQKCRGIAKNGEMITSTMRGVFRDDPLAKAELMQLLQF